MYTTPQLSHKHVTLSSSTASLFEASTGRDGKGEPTCEAESSTKPGFEALSSSEESENEGDGSDIGEEV